jgi:hypothetical protein
MMKEGEKGLHDATIDLEREAWSEVPPVVPFLPSFVFDSVCSDASVVISAAS